METSSRRCSESLNTASDQARSRRGTNQDALATSAGGLCADFHHLRADCRFMGTDSDQVRYERHGSTALVTIDRPERRNAVDGPTAEALQAAFERFEADPEARALVLTGAGGQAFCAGAD